MSRALGLPLTHPAALLATWFGSGLAPRAPGTVASFVACVLAWIIVGVGGTVTLVIAALIVLIIGIWAAGVVARESGVADAGAVVIDEVAAQWLTLAIVPRDLIFYGAGFLLFRLFDIAKPWPVSWADRTIPGGFGVMADDLLAAIYAMAILLAGRWILGR